MDFGPIGIYAWESSNASFITTIFELPLEGSFIYKTKIIS
jgi:hypothetical protein